MPTRLVEMAVDSADPSAQARFWAAALGWEVTDDEPDIAEIAPAGFDYPSPAALPLVFARVPEPKTVKNRVHLDLASVSAEDQAGQVRRLKDLGAVDLDIGQGDVPWVVLADPEGNEFCVLEPRDVYRGTGPVAAVVVDCADPAALARFWTEAAGWPVTGSGPDFASLRWPDGVGPYLEFLDVPDPKTIKNRVHLDVGPYPGDDQLAEVKRLQDLGASPADVGQRDVPWVVLADPEGNEFCVLTPR
ncbi:MAG TPA: VOC family protein [Streptosporangiaceae bacterium]